MFDSNNRPFLSVTQLPDGPEQISYPEEKLLKTCESVTLTTHCVRKHIIPGNDNKRVVEFLSIPLEQVTHCSIVSRDFPILIVLAFVIGIFGFISRESNATLAGLLLAALLICIYVASRHSETEIASPTAKIKFRINGANCKNAINFVNCVEREVASHWKYKVIQMTPSQPPKPNK